MIRPMVRIAATFLALGATIIAPAACGSSTSLTAQAESDAPAINLLGADVPEHVSAPRGMITLRTSGPLGPSAERCDGGAADSRRIVGVPSQEINRVERAHRQLVEIVHSTVYVLQSEAAALRELAVISSARARVCIERSFAAKRLADERNRKARSEPRLGPVSVVALRPLLGPRAYGLRLSGAESSAHGRVIRFYADSRGFVVGRALIVLTAFSAPRPYSPVVERHLLSLLYSRAKREL
jgi:hypothetical protein